MFGIEMRELLIVSAYGITYERLLQSGVLSSFLHYEPTSATYSVRTEPLEGYGFLNNCDEGHN